MMAKNLHDGLSEKRSNREPIATSDIDTGKTLVMTTTYSSDSALQWRSVVSPGGRWMDQA